MVQPQLFAESPPVDVEVRVVWVSLIERMARLGVGDTHYDVHEGRPVPARGRLARALELGLQRAFREAEASGVSFEQ